MPLIGAKVAQALIDTLPPGVMNLVQGDGAVGAALVGGDVQMVGMTGSTATGKKIMESASKDLKRLVLELGGKDPMVVFADADIEEVLKMMNSAFKMMDLAFQMMNLSIRRRRTPLRTAYVEGAFSYQQ